MKEPSISRELGLRPGDDAAALLAAVLEVAPIAVALCCGDP